MNRVRLTPWIGEIYSTTGYAGKRILALGESHYCEKASDATEDITQKVIADLFDPQSGHEAYKNTYTKFAEALLGRNCLSFEYKERFLEQHRLLQLCPGADDGSAYSTFTEGFQGI